MMQPPLVGVRYDPAAMRLFSLARPDWAAYLDQSPAWQRTRLGKGLVAVTASREPAGCGASFMSGTRAQQDNSQLQLAPHF